MKAKSTARRSHASRPGKRTDWRRFDAMTDEDIAAAVCFLASPEARYITGVNLTVNAGNLM